MKWRDRSGRAPAPSLVITPRRIGPSAEGEGKWIVFFAEWVMLEVGQGGAGDGEEDVDERRTLSKRP